MTQPRKLAHEIAGGRISALAAGSGPPLVALHHSIGPCGWTPLLADLARDHAVYAPELPGYGDSTRPEWARDPRDLAILLGLWLDAQRLGPVTILGPGYGGWIGAELAVLAPARISRLVLIGAAGLLPTQGRIHDQFLVSHLDYARAYFEDRARFDAVFGSEPGEASYSPLWTEVIVTWKSGRTPALLVRDDQIDSLAKKGMLTMRTTTVINNAPITKVGKGG